MTNTKPILIPTITVEGLVVPTPLVSALLQFATEDITRAHMTGLGLDDCVLGATDGHTAARVIGIDPGGQDPKARNGSWWPGEYVEMQIKLAKASKAPAILLAWDRRGSAQMKFPPLHAVIPAEGARNVHASEAIGLDPYYLARIAAVSLAVQGKRKTAGTNSVHLVSTPAKGAACDPFVFVVPGKHGAPTVEVVIMPVRV